jgi:hypothetical protein
MTMVVPSAPPGPRASHGGSDAGHVRRNAGDADFAAALSETAGDAIEENGGDEATAKVREMASPSPRAAPRLDARERRAMAAVDKADAATKADIRADAAAEGAFADVRDSAMATVENRAIPVEVPDVTDAGASSDKGPRPVVPGPEATSPRSDPVRDALAVLGGDLMAKRDTVAAAADLMMPARKSSPAGGTPSVAKRSEPAPGEMAVLDGPDLPGDGPDIGAIPIRVLRQETHFQPIAHEARRLLGMTAGPPDNRVLPLTFAAAAKIARPQALQRESLDMPVAPDRLVDAATAPAQASSVADGATLGPIGQQIADGVQRAIGSPSESATARPASGADPAAAPAFAPALRSIKLQLNPHSLGVVTIVLTGSDGELRVHLEAERAETFGKVEQERGALSARLNGAGFAISELTVARMGAADGQARGDDQREAAARQGGQMGGQQGDSGAREGAAQFAGERASRHPGEHATRAGAAAASATRGGAIEQTVAGVSYAGRFRPV